MIFVTGGTGLVGSHLLLELLRSGKTVKALKRKNSSLDNVRKVFRYYTADADELFNKIQWEEGDITDRVSLYDAMQDVEEVYHTAAIVSFSKKDRRQVLEYNVEGTASLVNISLEKKIKKFCFVSSTAALGAPDEKGHVDEQSLWANGKGRSVYSVSKYKSEMEVWRGITEGLNAVIVNPSIIIGPGEWKRSSSRMFLEIWKGLKFYTKGITGYVDVHDVVTCMTRLMESNLKGEKFIISEGNYSYQEIFGKIADVLGKKRPSIHATKTLIKMAWLGDSLVSSLTGKNPKITRETIKAGRNKVFFSNEKVKQALNFRFKPIDEAIKETGDLFLK